MSQFISHVMSSHVMYAKITLETLCVSLYYLAKQLSHVKLIIIFNHHLIVNISFKVFRYLPNVPSSFLSKLGTIPQTIASGCFVCSLSSLSFLPSPTPFSFLQQWRLNPGLCEY